LAGLHSKQSDRLTISMNAMHKIPSKFVPKKFTMTQKVANTKGCSKCCVGRNPYNGYKYLCGATPQGIFLMQWYDPLNKFMLLKVSHFLIDMTNGLYYGHITIVSDTSRIVRMTIVSDATTWSITYDGHSDDSLVSFLIIIFLLI
jgi:hypothetical protein